MNRIKQIGFDLEVGPEVSEETLEELFNELRDKINNSTNCKIEGIKSIGVFNSEDITEQYKELGYES